jgi:hypothetical protein
MQLRAWDMDRAQRCTETPRSRLAVVAAGETKGVKCVINPTRIARAIARFVVWNRDRPQRLADNGRDELFAACQDRDSRCRQAKSLEALG